MIKQAVPPGGALALHLAKLKLAISPNVGNSGAQFLVVGDCVRASPVLYQSNTKMPLLFIHCAQRLSPPPQAIKTCWKPKTKVRSRKIRRVAVVTITTFHIVIHFLLILSPHMLLGDKVCYSRNGNPFLLASFHQFFLKVPLTMMCCWLWTV